MAGQSFMLTVMHVRIICSRAGTCYAKLDGVGSGPAGGELDGESHAAAVRSSAGLLILGNHSALMPAGRPGGPVAGGRGR